MSLHNVPQQPHICHYCRCTFPTTGTLQRHITHFNQCCHKWNNEMQQADDVHDQQEMIPTMNPAPNDPDDSMDMDVDMNEHEHDTECKYITWFAAEFVEKPAAEILGHDLTMFERIKAYQDQFNLEPYALFADCEEWDLAKWLI
ncbi:hypothetical protein J3R82DRAFT_1364 [Butyriboletus roseoflavus]|nr:hypothetical protein J3R82DRAFT_1364 [Butyriboletus roseoflavus]